MGSDSTGRMTRPELRAKTAGAASRVLSKALSREDVTPKELADCCVRRQKTVYQWTDHNDAAHEPKLSDLALMPREIALHLLRWVAEQQQAKVIDYLRSAMPGDLLSAMSCAQREASEAVIAACDAVRDGAIDDQEARRIAEEAEEAGRAFFAIAEAMRSRLAVQ